MLAGEISIAAALTIAETGHLVFATLHTNSAAEAVNRMVDVFPSDQQQQILAQLGDRIFIIGDDLVTTNDKTIEIVEPLLPFIDYFMPSLEEARDLLGEMEIAARIMITGGDAREDARMSRADRLVIRRAILEALKRTAARALSECDAVIITAGSSASTCNTSPSASDLSRLRAFRTGRGHSRPVASRVSVISLIPGR